MTFDEMSDLFCRMEHLECVFFYNDMLQERDNLRPLFKRLALYYDKDTSIEKDYKMVLSKYSKLIKEYDDKHQMRL